MAGNTPWMEHQFITGQFARMHFFTHSFLPIGILNKPIPFTGKYLQGLRGKQLYANLLPAIRSYLQIVHMFSIPRVGLKDCQDVK